MSKSHLFLKNEFGICLEFNHTRGRDDNEETLKSRLSEYHLQTEPLIEYYKSLNVLHNVNGSQDLDVLFNEIKSILKGE